MERLSISLKGYTDLPPGKIANVVTYLALDAPPAEVPADRLDLRLVRISAPSVRRYRNLVSRIGDRWLWTSRAGMSDAEILAMLTKPGNELHVLLMEDAEIGLIELHADGPEAIEVHLFGVVEEATGTGAGRWLMLTALARIFRPPVRRVWLHTCTFDHPAALPFYRKIGFRPWKFAIEVDDDPRLSGLMPETAGPHVPLLKPSKV
jgi:GNAT superfamily N-acetyltransferase